MKNIVYFIKENSSNNFNKNEVINFIKKYYENHESYEYGDVYYYNVKKPGILITNIGELNGNNIICKLPIELDKFDGEIGFAEGEFDNMQVIINDKFAFLIDIWKDLDDKIYEEFCHLYEILDIDKISKREYDKLIKDMNI